MQQKQRDLLAKSMMDLANLVAVALVFSQFVTPQPFRGSRSNGAKTNDPLPERPEH
jgi:hypothetical protein